MGGCSIERFGFRINFKGTRLFCQHYKSFFCLRTVVKVKPVQSPTSIAKNESGVQLVRK